MSQRKDTGLNINPWPKLVDHYTFLIAFFGSKGIFYLFSFNYSVFSDTFDIQKLLIDLGVFGVLFYISSIGVNYFTSNKK